MSSERKSPDGAVGDDGNESVEGSCRKGQKAGPGLSSQLEAARLEEADRKRMARRKAWREEVRKELGKREEFKEEMESVPLEDVEVEEKPLMSRLSVGWREAFKNDRAGFLFPEAMRVMVSSKFAVEPCPSEDAQVLQLRLISKSVREVIDDIHSNDAAMFDFYIGFRSVSINTLEEATSLSKKFGQVVNPFLFHCLWISPPYYWDSKTPAFWKEIGAILARWGKEVWSASIQFPAMSKDAETPNDYDLLVAYLKLMPNIRRLFISGGFEKMDVSKLKDRIATNPLPEMPYLRFVSLDASMSNIEAGGGAESGSIIIAHSLLAQYSRNLETIQLDSATLPLEGDFPSLQKLELVLTRLTGMDDLVNMGIFKCLNNWGTPLKELTLEASGTDPQKVLSNALNGLFLALPHLETVSFTFFHLPLETLDILLPCKSLKTIIYNATQYHCTLDPWSPNDDKGIFRFPDRSNIYESNIWKLLPELKLIMVDISTYRRPDQRTSVPFEIIKKRQYTLEGYQQHCKLQNVQRDVHV